MMGEGCMVQGVCVIGASLAQNPMSTGSKVPDSNMAVDSSMIPPSSLPSSLPSYMVAAGVQDRVSLSFCLLFLLRNMEEGNKEGEGNMLGEGNMMVVGNMVEVGSSTVGVDNSIAPFLVLILLLSPFPHNPVSFRDTFENLMRDVLHLI